MKQRIRLTESDLHRIIKESVKQAINETSDGYKAYHAGKAWEAGGGDNPLRRFGHSILHPFKHRKYNRQAKKFGKSAVMDKPTQTMHTASGHTVSYRPDYNEKTGRFDINRNNSFKDERFVSSKIKKGHVPNTNSSLLSPDIDANELDGPVQYLNTYFNLGKGSVKAKRQNESKLNRIIKESVRRILREGFNQFDDSDFASTGDPYGLRDDNDMDESNLNGFYGSFNNINVKIENDGKPNARIVISSKRGDNEVELNGEEALDILDKVRDDADYYGNINTAIYRNMYKFVI